MALLNNSGTENRFPAANNTEKNSCELDVSVTKIICNPSKTLADQVESHTKYSSSDLASQDGILLELSYKSPCALTGLQFKLDLEKLDIPKGCKVIRAVGGKAGSSFIGAATSAGFTAINSNNHIIVYDNPETPSAEKTQINFLSATPADYSTGALGAGAFIDVYCNPPVIVDPLYRFYFDASGADPTPTPGGNQIQVNITGLASAEAIASAFKSAVEGVFGTPFQVSFKTGTTTELVINPKTTGNQTDSSVATIASSALTLSKLNDGRDSQLAASTTFTPLCYVLLGSKECKKIDCPDSIEVSDVLGAVNTNLKAPPATWTGEARKGVLDINGLYYCAGLISGKNKYDVKFDTEIDGFKKITIIDLVTLANKIRYNLGEDSQSTSGTNFVPEACCNTKDDVGCFADAEILEIKEVEGVDGKKDMYVVVGYTSSDPVSGIQFDLGYNVFVNSKAQATMTLRDSVKEKWFQETATVKNRFGFDRITRVLTYQTPFDNQSSEELSGSTKVEKDSLFRKYKNDTLSDANKASEMLQEYSLPAASTTMPLVIVNIRDIEALGDYAKSRFEYAFDPPVEGKNRPNFIRDYKKGDEYTGEVSYFNGYWYTGSQFVPGKSIRLRRVYDYFDLLNVRIVTNSRRDKLSHGKETPPLDYIGKRVVYDFDPTEAPFTTISSSSNLRKYFNSILKTFNEKALLNGLRSVSSLSRYDSDIKFVTPTDIKESLYNDNGFNTDANLDGVFDVADVLALSNLASFRAIVGIDSPSSINAGSDEIDNFTAKDQLDTSLGIKIKDFSSTTTRLDTSQVDVFIPNYVCRNNLVTTAMPETCPDIQNSVYDGMFLYMTDRVEVTDSTAPSGFRSWDHYFFDLHGLQIEEVPRPNPENTPYYYFEVWAATNTPKTKFINSATFSLNLCDFYGADNGTDNAQTISFYVVPGEHFDMGETQQVNIAGAPALIDHQGVGVTNLGLSTVSGDFNGSATIPAPTAAASDDRILRVTVYNDVSQNTAHEAEQKFNSPITGDGGGLCLAKVFMRIEATGGSDSQEILWDQGRKISFETGAFTYLSTNYNLCEVNYTNTPTSNTTKQLNSDSSSLDGYLAVGPNLSFTSQHYKDNSASSHTYGEFNLHLKIVNENTVDVMYASDKPFNRVQFGIKNDKFSTVSSVDETIYAPSYSGYTSSVSLTGSTNPDGFAVINVYPTGTVTDLSGSGTLCRIQYGTNIFDKDVISLGKILACPPLGGDDSSRELLIPDLYNRDELGERGEFYSSYGNGKLALHIKSDKTFSPLSTHPQTSVIDENITRDANLRKTARNFVTGTIGDAIGKRLTHAIINPYGHNASAANEYFLSQSSFSPYIEIDSSGYRSLGINGTDLSGLKQSHSYISGSSTQIDTDVTEDFTMFVVYQPLAGTQVACPPMHIYGNHFFDGVAHPGVGAAGGEAIALRCGSGQENGNSHLQGTPALMDTLAGSGTTTNPVVSLVLSGTIAAKPNVELWHEFENQTEAEKRHIVCYKHKYFSAVGYVNEIGRFRVDGDLANGAGLVNQLGSGGYVANPIDHTSTIGTNGAFIIGHEAGSMPGGSDYDNNRYNGLDFRGSVSEILYFTEALSDEDLLRMEGYLAHKWGTQDLLPDKHPYKNRKSLHEVLGETEKLAYVELEDYNKNPHRNELLSDKSSAIYTSENICIKHNTDPVTRITGGVYRAPGTLYPGYTPTFNPKTGVSSKDLLLWIDPSDSTTLVQTVSGVGNTVTSIKDKALDPGISLPTDAGFHQGVASQQPTRQTISGLDMLSFDGTNDKMVLMDNNFADSVPLSDLNGGDFDIYIVFRPLLASTGNTSADAGSNTSLLGEAGGWFGANIYGANTVTPSIQAYVYAGGSNQLPTTPGASITNGTTHQIQFSRESGNLKVSTDGGAQTTMASGAPGTLSGIISIAQTAWGGLYYQGYIGEILIYSGELSGADRTSVISYLQGKWSTP